MKKLLFIFFLFLGLNIFAQNVTRYSYLEVKNASGKNFLDISLTYDDDYPCYNNIKLFAEDQDINCYFQIYLDGVKVYDGWLKMKANTEYFLDDAFKYCEAKYKDVLVETQARFE